LSNGNGTTQPAKNGGKKNIQNDDFNIFSKKRMFFLHILSHCGSYNK
jgi:hypothetical protein